jgi:hypothetical protein
MSKSLKEPDDIRTLPTVLLAGGVAIAVIAVIAVIIYLVIKSNRKTPLRTDAVDNTTKAPDTETAAIDVAPKGFKPPKKRYVAANIFIPKYGYYNLLALPRDGFSNHPYKTLPPKYRQKLGSVASHSHLIVIDGVSVDSGTRVSPNCVLITKHDLAGRSKNITIVSSFTRYAPCTHTPVARVILHPDKDAALLFAPDLPALTTSLKLDFTEQPRGGYYLAHHAGGLPLQFSTGRIPNHGDLYAYQHELLADAGPLASGCGMFDGHTLSLTAMSVERTTQYGRMARKVLKLSEIHDWLTPQLARMGAMPPPASTSSYQALPPPPLMFDVDPDFYYDNDAETLTWARAKALAREIKRFLAGLADYMRLTPHQRKTKPHPKLLKGSTDLPAKVEVFDGHQYQHLGARAGKTRINPLLGSSAQHPTLASLGIATRNLVALFHRIPDQDKARLLTCNTEEAKWAVDFSPIKVGPAAQTTLYVDINPHTKFHVFPIHSDDTRIAQGKVNVILANALLDYVEAHQVQQPVRYYRTK